MNDEDEDEEIETPREALEQALPREMARVRDEVLPAYDPGQFAARLMRLELDHAAKALAEGGVVAMLRSYKALKGCYYT